MADQGPRNRRAPADAARGRIRLVIADDGDCPAVVVFVGKLDRRPEPHLVSSLLKRRVDDLRLLHDAREVTEPAVDLAKPPLAVDVIGIFGTIAEGRGPDTVKA